MITDLTCYMFQPVKSALADHDREIPAHAVLPFIFEVRPAHAAFHAKKRCHGTEAKAIAQRCRRPGGDVAEVVELGEGLRVEVEREGEAQPVRGIEVRELSETHRRAEREIVEPIFFTSRARQ